MFFRNSSGSYSVPFSQTNLLPSGLSSLVEGVFSIDDDHRAARPFSSTGSCTFTAIWCPPAFFQSRTRRRILYRLSLDAAAISSSNAFVPKLSFPTSFRRSSTWSPVSKPPTSAAWRAALIIFCAVDSPISAMLASSEDDDTAMASIEPKPASLIYLLSPGQRR